MKALPQYLSDLLHLRYVAGVRAKEGLSRGMFTFADVGGPECGVPGCLKGWLKSTPEGLDVCKRLVLMDIAALYRPVWEIGKGPFKSRYGSTYGIFSVLPHEDEMLRTEAEELDYRLNWVDEEITRECIKQGLCPEETPKAYEHSLEKEAA